MNDLSITSNHSSLRVECWARIKSFIQFRFSLNIIYLFVHVFQFFKRNIVSISNIPVHDGTISNNPVLFQFFFFSNSFDWKFLFILVVTGEHFWEGVFTHFWVRRIFYSTRAIIDFVIKYIFWKAPSNQFYFVEKSFCFVELPQLAQRTFSMKLFLLLLNQAIPWQKYVWREIFGHFIQREVRRSQKQEHYNAFG